MNSVPPSDAGAAGGVLQTMQQLGGTLGLAVMVTVAGSAADGGLLAGMDVAFMVAAGVSLLTFFVALTFRGR
jgi:hypothetical protein